MDTAANHPILTLEQAKRFENELFGGDEAKEWSAMLKAGAAVARSVMQDFREIGDWPTNATLLVLVGKGHNGGDAMIAARTIMERTPGARVDLWLLFGERELRPLAARAYRELVQSAADRVRLVGRTDSLACEYDVSLDGVFGFQFRPPLSPGVREIFEKLNTWPVRLRAAIDLPSGLGAPGSLRADFTYATGSVKAPIVAEAHRSTVGRARYLDLGFFDASAEVRAGEYVLTEKILDPLRRLRTAASDKRSYGHLFLVGGSRSYPGAIMMSALAAVRSGVGLVTAFVPESFAAAFAARLPEVMWVGWPETPEGGLSLEGTHLLRERVSRANALVIGPGLSREREALALAKDVVSMANVSLVIDADALHPEIATAGQAPRVLTPHAGEFERIAGARGLDLFSREAKATTVLKGPLTRISAGEAIHLSCFGGPVLARGGSGDILAGLIGGLLAQSPGDVFGAACCGVVWHGMAADRLARAHGQVALQTTQLIDFLADALRDQDHER